MPARDREIWVARARVFDPTVEEVQPYLIFSAPTGDIDHVSFGDVLDKGTPPLTVAVRFRTTTRALSTLAGRWQTTPSEAGYLLRLTASGQIQAQIASDGNVAQAVSADVDYDDGDWHWAALRWRPDRFLETIFDGSLVAGPESFDQNISSSGNFIIASFLGLFQRFLGDIDRVVVWLGGENVAGNEPSISEIGDHMTGNLRRMADEGELGEFVHAAIPMDEGFGSVVHDVQVHDGFGGEPFDGELVNDVRWSERFKGEVDLWFASETLQVDPGDIAPPGVITRLIKSPLSIRAQAIQGTKLATAALPQFGDFVYLNPRGEFDGDFDLHWSHRRLEIFQGAKDIRTGKVVIGDMDLKWSGRFGGEPKGDEDTITVSLRGFDDLFSRNLRRRIFRSGWEPWLRFNGTNNHVSHGDVANVVTGEFTLAVILRSDTVAPTVDTCVIGRKNQAGVDHHGYAILASPDGSIRAVATNTGDAQTTLIHELGGVPGYADGRKHVVIFRRTSTHIELYHARGDRSDELTPDLVDSASFSSALSLTNSVEFRVGAFANGTDRYTGQVERYWFKGEAVDIDDVMEDLNTPFGDDAPLTASPLIYVPLSENLGTAVGDLGSAGAHGSFAGDTDPEQWDGFRNGTRESNGAPMPIGFGRAEMVDAVLVDPIKQVYAIHDDVVTEIDRVTEGGLTIDVDKTTTGDLWVNPPISGEWRRDSLSVNRGLFRLSGFPSLPVRADVTYASEALRTPAQIILRLLQRVSDAEISTNVRGFDFVNDVTQWESSLYLIGHVAVKDAVSEVASGAGIFWTVDMRDPYDSINRVIITLWRPRVLDPTRPEDEPQVWLSFGQEFIPDDIRHDGIRRRGEHPVYRSVEISFGRLTGFMSLTEIAGSLPEEEKQRIMNEWRTATSEAGDPDGMFLNPDDLEVHSPILRKLDAQAFADEQLDLYQRKLPVFEVELTESRFERWIGDRAQVTGPRFGMDDGKLFIVVGVDDDADGDGSTLTLWGGFDVE